MRRLIVNADDYGMTPGVSAGILRAHRHGIVTSTTAMVNLDIPAGDVSAARDSGIGLGLHVNLTLGKPIARVRSLVDGSGQFVRDPRRAAIRAVAADVTIEVEAQVERFVALFKQTPTHLDTHHHAGLYDPVAEVVLETAKALGIAVRSQNQTVRARARSAGLRTTDHFGGESGPDAYWSRARTLANLRRLAPGTTEFMAHPGVFDEALGGSRYGRQREVELIGLGSPEARAAVAALGVTLCQFGDL
jgi:predicted glycoside hydrolase/deacetylase ChbG (UPF0249 family)